MANKKKTPAKKPAKKCPGGNCSPAKPAKKGAAKPKAKSEAKPKGKKK